MFEEYDKDTSGTLGLNELAAMFQELSSKLTSYPAVGHIRNTLFAMLTTFWRAQTAQVASQQGQYLGKKFRALAKVRPEDKNSNDVDDSVYAPFKYAHMGSLGSLWNNFGFLLEQTLNDCWHSLHWQ